MGSTPGLGTLEKLLDGFPLDQFLKEYYLKLPLGRRGGVSNLVTISAAELKNQLLERSDLDGLIGDPDGRSQPFQTLTPEEAQEHLRAGATLGFREIHRCHAEMRELSEGLEREFASPIDIHLYWTPAGQRGFGWHYDAEEVFLLQLSGQKTWRFRKNTVNPWPVKEALPHDQHAERELMPVMSCCLRENDWLYLPSGYWHRGKAEEESLSLSIGVEAPTALTIFDVVRRSLPSLLEWRERLPLAGAAGSWDEAQLEERYRPIFERLGESLASLFRNEELMRDFIREHHARQRTEHSDSESNGTQT